MRKIYYMIGLVSLIFLTQCNWTNKPTNNKERTVCKIVIQVFPVFYTHSLLICDITNNDLIFERLGDVRFIKEDANYDIKPCYLKFRNEAAIFLSDSILANFNEADFSDSYLDVEDGITSNALFIFSDNTIKNIKLSNSSTENQNRLILFLLEKIENDCNDSTTIEYLELLMKSYK